MFLSIIIPAYNEEVRLQNTLQRIYSYFKNKSYSYELIVVDDGSLDKTKQVVLGSHFFKEGNLILLENQQNKGKGFSVKRGILAAKGEYILFTDSDLSTPIEEFEKLFSYLQSGYDIAVGSRTVQGAQVRIHQPFYREFMGKCFNALVQFFVFKGVLDTQCGFKLFNAKTAKVIAPYLKIDGFAFDVELLYLAKKHGYKMIEVPVVWMNSPSSRVNPLFDSLRMFAELIAIKKLHEKDKA